MARGRTTGTKNFQGRNFGAFQLRGIYANIKKAAERGSSESVVDLAPRFLAYIAETEPGFNDYTGNLANSYAAKVFVKGKYLRTFFHDTGFHGQIHISHGKRGGRYALLRTEKLRHPFGRRKKMRIERDIYGNVMRSVEGFDVMEKPKRYLKKWERRSYRNWNRSYDKGLQLRNKQGRFVSQSWIEIENQAPYAEMVQQARGAARFHYNVLRGARVERLKNETTMLVKRATLAELKKAGFKVR